MHSNMKEENTFKKNISLILINVVIFFAVLDGLRDTFLPQLSILRDLFICLTIVFSLLYHHKLKFNKTSTILIISFFFVAFYTFFITLLVDPSTVYIREETSSGGFGFWSKYLSFVILIFFLTILFKTNKNYYKEKIINIYIFYSIVYSLLTMIVIFLLPSYYSSLEPRNWYGRLSIGYPTQDVLVLGVSLFFLSYTKLTKFFSLIVFIILSVVILMQNNFTGYMIFFTLLILKTINGSKLEKLSSTIFIILILLFSIYLYKFYYQFGTFGDLFKYKIDSQIFKTTTDAASVDARIEQIKLLSKTLYSDNIFVIFGYGGIGGFSSENTLFSVIGFSGFLGLLIYLISIFWIIISSIKQKDFFIFGLALLYLVGAVSISAYYLISTYFIYAFLIAYTITNNKFKHSNITER